jgi:hypothetical protein
MRKPLAGPMQQRSGIISALAADECPMYRSFISITATNIGVQLQKQRFAPLAQSVERIHGKENPGAILVVR